MSEKRYCFVIAVLVVMMSVTGLLCFNEVEETRKENAEFREIIMAQSEMIEKEKAINDELFKMVDELLEEKNGKESADGRGEDPQHEAQSAEQDD